MAFIFVYLSGVCMRVCARLLFICHLLVNLNQRKHLNKAASKWNRWWRCDSKFNTRNLHTNFHTDFTDYTEAMACRFSAGITIFSFFSLLTYTFLTWPIQIWFKGRKPLLRWCRRLVYIAACAVWFRCRCSFCHKIYEYSTRWLKSALNWQTSYPSSSLRGKFLFSNLQEVRSMKSRTTSVQRWLVPRQKKKPSSAESTKLWQVKFSLTNAH